MEKYLLVNNIIPFSNVDGDGNRCGIFVQGCNLNCIYCHNSETIQVCRNCGDCVDTCPADALTMINGKIKYDKSKCIECDKCIMVCKYQSTPKALLYSKEELINIIKKYKPFIRGITVSGGEATLYSEFLVELFKEVKKMGLTCYIDTNGYFDIDKIYNLINITDKFLFDIKGTGNQMELCGINSDKPIENLKKLLIKDKIAEVRTISLIEITDCKETVIKVSKVLKDYSDVKYIIIKVRKEGLKLKQIEQIENYIPNNEYIDELKELAKIYGAKRVEIRY